MKKTTSTTKKRKKRTERSPRQQWVSERKFEAYGSLTGIHTRLEQLIKMDSMTLDDAKLLRKASSLVDVIMKRIRYGHNEDASYWRFCERKGFVK